MVMQIKDKLGRPIRDLRISVTDRCNFRCDYCMPKEIFGDDFVFLPKDELLTFEEIERIAEIYAELGVKKITYYRRRTSTASKFISTHCKA